MASGARSRWCTPCSSRGGPWSARRRTPPEPLERHFRTRRRRLDSRPMRHLLALGLLVLALPSALAAQGNAPSLDTARIDSVVAAGMTTRRLVGVSVGIMEEGRIVFVKGYGAANVATHARVDTTTRFAIGSVTKQFTCAIILQLAAEGRLSVDDAVAKYLPDPTRAADITLRDLMA